MKTKSQITLAQILEAGHASEQAPHVLALCRHLDCTPDGISLECYDHYGLALYSTPSGDYAIGTDDEATQATVANIRDFRLGVQRVFYSESMRPAVRTGGRHPRRAGEAMRKCQ